jgi:hypothetical protein
MTGVKNVKQLQSFTLFFYKPFSVRGTLFRLIYADMFGMLKKIKNRPPVKLEHTQERYWAS